MSKKYPECPHYNHNNCKHAHSPKVCALARDDQICLREKPNKDEGSIQIVDTVNCKEIFEKKITVVSKE